MKKSLLLILLLATITISKADIWTRKADFPGGNKQHIGGFSIGNKGYIGTGSGGINIWNGEFWEWDQITNTWTQKANFPGQGRVMEIGFSIGTKGYIGTGVYYNLSNYFLNDFWEWDQISNTWTQKSIFPGGSRSSAVGFSIGLKGYIGTGGNANVYFQDLWEWNQTTDIWTQKADFPGGKRIDAVGFSIGTKGYIGTGTSFNSITHSDTLFADFWEYDPSSNFWTRKNDVQGGKRAAAVGFAIGTKGYLGIGTLGAHSIYSDFWEWDQTNNIWTQKADFGGGQRCASNCFSIGNKGYVCYGSNDTTTLNDLWEYFPDTTNSIPELTQEIKTSLYPNPMYDKTTLTIQGSSKNALLNIYDINGQKVR
ncbi:MAG: hypothetical protein WCL14_12000, partial [Bacteroidota bacterium]